MVNIITGGFSYFGCAWTAMTSILKKGVLIISSHVLIKEHCLTVQFAHCSTSMGTYRRLLPRHLQTVHFELSNHHIFRSHCMHLEERCVTVCANIEGTFGEGQNSQAPLSLWVHLVLDRTIMITKWISGICKLQKYSQIHHFWSKYGW